MAKKPEEKPAPGTIGAELYQAKDLGTAGDAKDVSLKSKQWSLADSKCDISLAGSQWNIANSKCNIPLGGKDVPADLTDAQVEAALSERRLGIRRSVNTGFSVGGRVFTNAEVRDGKFAQATEQRKAAAAKSAAK